MFFNRLIFIMLVATGLLLPTRVSAAEAVPTCTLESVDQNNDRPQWSDLGMEHILAVNGQSNITPSSSVRLVSHGRRLANGNSLSAGCHQETALPITSHGCNVWCAARFCASWTKGYLYIIHCLRL